MTRLGAGVWRWAALAVYAAAILVVAADPEPAGLGAVGDKWYHGMAYAVFAALAYWATHGGGATSFLMAATHGGLVELVQMAVPGRDASLADFLADLAGAAIGLGLVAAWRAWTRA